MSDDDRLIQQIYYHRSDQSSQSRPTDHSTPSFRKLYIYAQKDTRRERELDPERYPELPPAFRGRTFTWRYSIYKQNYYEPDDRASKATGWQTRLQTDYYILQLP